MDTVHIDRYNELEDLLRGEAEGHPACEAGQYPPHETDHPSVGDGETCAADATWRAMTDPCGDTFLYCDRHRQRALALMRAHGNSWSCGKCGTQCCTMHLRPLRG